MLTYELEAALEAEGYTAGQLVANCAAHRHGIYFHQY